jgi:hypothetical protein
MIFNHCILSTTFFHTICISSTIICLPEWFFNYYLLCFDYFYFSIAYYYEHCTTYLEEHISYYYEHYIVTPVKYIIGLHRSIHSVPFHSIHCFHSLRSFNPFLSFHSRSFHSFHSIHCFHSLRSFTSFYPLHSFVSLIPFHF